jgi:hypothetical protein
MSVVGALHFPTKKYLCEFSPHASLFQGNSITGGTFNIHISSASSSASNTMIGASPKAKKLQRLLPLESDSSQDDSQEK